MKGLLAGDAAWVSFNGLVLLLTLPPFYDVMRRP